MLLRICDLLSTFCQSFLFIWLCNNIVPKANKISKVKMSILTTIIFFDIWAFTTYSSINQSIANFMALIVILILLLLVYKKRVLDVFVGFFLVHFLITLSTYFIVTINHYCFIKLNLSISVELNTFLFEYVLLFLSYSLFYVLRKHIFNVSMFLKNLKHSLIIIQLMTYSTLLVNTLFVEWATINMNPMLETIIYIISFLVFIFTAIYFAKINDKSKEAEILNIALNEKINEIRKAKHDYGSEISSLYGLYQLGKIDKLGELLKGIVEKNQSFTPGVSVIFETNPLVASILNTTVTDEINVMSFDGGDYENLSTTSNELVKIISNIIRNSVDALANVKNPTIKYRSYNTDQGIAINISNNGPQIPQELRSKIFETGYSSKKNNSSDRGFGLSIVKEIIDKCNGKISVRSNMDLTQFVFEIPYKKSNKKKFIDEMQ